MNGHWWNGIWYPYTYNYVVPCTACSTNTRVVEQLLKRIADLEAKLDKTQETQ